MPSEYENLLNAALNHVPFEGMNDAALRAGAGDIDMPPSLARVYFPQGGAGLAAAYHRRADAQLRDWLEAAPAGGRFRDRVAGAVMHRLALVDPELVRAAAATLALPGNAALGLRLIWESADVIWTGLGDDSDNADWYSKRASLAAVIGPTVLFWLGDDSPGSADTRGFLDRRIEGLMRFQTWRKRLGGLPGAEALSRAVLGGVHPPRSRDLPGRATAR